MYLDVFESASVFYPCCVSVHMETMFYVTKSNETMFQSLKVKSISKRSQERMFLKAPFSCCRVDGLKQSVLD